jgi:excisionase family DNA binding protein
MQQAALVSAGTWKGETSMSGQLAYSPAEAAELGGISLAKLYDEARHNRLTIRKSGRRSLITHRDLEAWLNGLPKKPAPLANSAAA